MKWVVVMGLAALAMIAVPVLGSDWNMSGNWETRYMGHKVKGTVHRQGNDISGVLYVYPPFSKEKWTFHYTGKIDGDRVYASHSDGHVFRGKIRPDRRVEGTITTKDGYRLPVNVAPRGGG
jgi:hypothetical protein